MLRSGRIVVDEVGDPPLLPGHVLLETVACGICGTDLHTRRFAHQFVEAARATGFRLFDFDPDADLVMGHEFSGRIVALGPGSGPGSGEGLALGDVVVAHPAIRGPGGPVGVGYSNEFPGAFAERVLVRSDGVLRVPAGLDPRVAALTEPVAVGIHAVDRSQAVARRSAIVLGCGPVGLAVIAALRLRGVELIVAADFSAARRHRAGALGAHVTVDPASAEPVAAWRAAGGRGPTTLFDAVGVPGMIEQAVIAAPARSDILVVGLCMQPDTFRPAIAINKELQLTFVLGWTPEEFAAALAALAEGSVDGASLITGEVPLEGVAAAFDDLAHPDRHVKVLVRPNG